MNRKLIRTTLAEVKQGSRVTPQPRERNNGGAHRGGGSGPSPRAAQQVAAAVQCASAYHPTETSARFSTTRNKLTLTHRWSSFSWTERRLRTIEWYDRGALKVNADAQICLC